MAAGGGQAGDGVDAALKADGAGVDGAGVDVVTYAAVGKGTFVHPLATDRIGTDGRPSPAHGGTAAMADDPDLNRRVAQFLVKQNEIAGRVIDA